MLWTVLAFGLARPPYWPAAQHPGPTWLPRALLGSESDCCRSSAIAVRNSTTRPGVGVVPGHFDRDCDRHFHALSLQSVIIAGLIVLMRASRSPPRYQSCGQATGLGTARFAGALTTLLKLTFGAVRCRASGELLGWTPMPNQASVAGMDALLTLLALLCLRGAVQGPRRYIPLVMLRYGGLRRHARRIAGAGNGGNALPAAFSTSGMVVMRRATSMSDREPAQRAHPRARLILLVPGSLGFRIFNFVFERDVISGRYRLRGGRCPDCTRRRDPVRQPGCAADSPQPLVARDYQFRAGCAASRRNGWRWRRVGHDIAIGLAAARPPDPGCRRRRDRTAIARKRGISGTKAWSRDSVSASSQDASQVAWQRDQASSYRSSANTSRKWSCSTARIAVLHAGWQRPEAAVSSVCDHAVSLGGHGLTRTKRRPLRAVALSQVPPFTLFRLASSIRRGRRGRALDASK